MALDVLAVEKETLAEATLSQSRYTARGTYANDH